MERQPLVTVVIPAYNPGAYLREAIASVEDQTYSQWECVVVDDGSTEDLAWVDTVSPRVRRVRQVNRGLPAARNAGIRNARGELIAFLDADDLWLPGKLHAQVSTWRDNAGLSATGFYRFTLTTRLDGWLPKAADRDDLLRGNSIFVSSVMTGRAALDRVGGFDEDLRAAEDWDMWLRLLQVGPLVAIDDILAGYRVHDGQMSGNPLRLWRSSLKVIRKQHAPVAPSVAGVRRMGELYGAQIFDRFRARRRPTDLLLAAAMAPVYVFGEVARLPRRLWRRRPGADVAS